MSRYPNVPNVGSWDPEWGCLMVMAGAVVAGLIGAMLFGFIAAAVITKAWFMVAVSMFGAPHLGYWAAWWAYVALRTLYVSSAAITRGGDK